MIRAATILWVALAALVGVGLFQLKHEVQALDEELVRLNRQIAQEHRTIHVLKAEWSYINQPQRLERLAQRHLDLVPMKPQQITRLADLPRRPAEPAIAATEPSSAGRSATPNARPQSQIVGGNRAAPVSGRGAPVPGAPRVVQPARSPATVVAARPVADRAATTSTGPR